jgi:hypothetical protein
MSRIDENAGSDVDHTVIETATTISEPSTKAYDPKDGDYVEGDSKHETIPEATSEPSLQLRIPNSRRHHRKRERVPLKV